MSIPTFREVLANQDQFPPELIAQAKNLYEATLVYTGHAERAIAGIVRDRFALRLDREETGRAIGKILDMQEDIEKRASEAFADIAADFPLKPKEVAAPPPPPAPTPTPTLPPAQVTVGAPPAVPEAIASAPSLPPAPVQPSLPLEAPAPAPDIAQLIKDKLAAGGGTPSTPPVV